MITALNAESFFVLFNRLMDLLAYHTIYRIIYQTMLQAKITTKITRTTAYYRFTSWLYCHENNHC